MNEQELCKKRLIDLSRQASRKGIVLFSDFLNLSELNIFHQCKPMFETETQSFGGIECAERQMIAFLPDALSYTKDDIYPSAFDTVYSENSRQWESSTCSIKQHFPITALKITPSHPKFAEKLGHRDILGAIMQLGVDRAKLGDIIIQEEEYYVICEENIASYFIENLHHIRHTAVQAEITDISKLHISQNLIEKDGIVTSNRLDAITSCVYKLSRSQSLSLIHAEKIYVNGAVMRNPSYCCCDNDIISVRGYGRFVFDGIYSQTNKGRLKIKFRIYNS